MLESSVSILLHVTPVAPKMALKFFLENGPNWLSRNVGKQLPLNPMSHLRRAQESYRNGHVL
jgi:hypothetical protein